MKSNPYLGIGNPYMGMYGNPFPMKSPEQYQAELMAQVQPQMQQYRQMYDASQAQMKAEENSGIYYKVQSYDEMMRIQAPAEGRPIMVFDENAGRLYSKKFQNGQTYVTGFQLVPLDSGSCEKPAQPQSQQSQETQNAQFDFSKLENVLENIDKRLNALENPKNEPAAAPAQ